MTERLIYQNQITDNDWGCTHSELVDGESDSIVSVCHVKLSDLTKLSIRLTEIVQDESWMLNLDEGTTRSYTKTVAETASELVEIFNSVKAENELTKEFGEIMISMGSARALELLFEHSILPIAEIWKPQRKQNEGFDFHTVCPSSLINFGEAKYSSSSTPHSNAINQAKGFIDEEKHLRDRVHLINITNTDAIANLDNDKYGVIVAFSLNVQKPLDALNFALTKVGEIFGSRSASSIYLIGVSH